MIVPGAYMGSVDNRDVYSDIPISENISNFTNFIGIINICLSVYAQWVWTCSQGFSKNNETAFSSFTKPCYLSITYVDDSFCWVKHFQSVTRIFM